MRSDRLDYVEDPLSGFGGSPLVCDQVFVDRLDGVVGAVGRQRGETVLRRVVGGVTSDGGRQHDQRLVAEGLHSRALLGEGTPHEEFLDAAGEVACLGELCPYLVSGLRWEVAVGEGSVQAGEAEPS